MSELIPFQFEILDKDQVEILCDTCIVYASSVTVKFNPHLSVFTPMWTGNFNLCRSCLNRTRATLKAVLKDLPQLPKKIHPGN